MSGTLAPLGIAVLALLVERPMHPYEMSQTLRDRHEDTFVKITTGSLYRQVDRLVDNGLARAVAAERQGNRPERTVYEVTDRGRSRLDRALSEIVRTPQPEYPIFPVALGEAHNLSPERLVADLTARKASLSATLAQFDEGLAKARDRGVHDAYLMAADYTAHTLRSDIAWLIGLVDRLTTQELTWPTTPTSDEAESHP